MELQTQVDWSEPLQRAEGSSRGKNSVRQSEDFDKEEGEPFRLEEVKKS